VPQDESCFALYRAVSEQQVLAAGRLAGLMFDRVVSAVWHPVTSADRPPGGR
jgi:hypothetical protein